MKYEWPSGNVEVILFFMVVGLIAPSSNCIFSKNTTHRTCILYTTVHIDFLHFAGSYHRSEYQLTQSSTYSFLSAVFPEFITNQLLQTPF